MLTCKDVLSYSFHKDVSVQRSSQDFDHREMTPPSSPTATVRPTSLSLRISLSTWIKLLMKLSRTGHDPRQVQGYSDVHTYGCKTRQENHTNLLLEIELLLSPDPRNALPKMSHTRQRDRPIPQRGAGEWIVYRCFPRHVAFILIRNLT